MNRYLGTARCVSALLGIGLASILPSLAQQNLLELPAEKANQRRELGISFHRTPKPSRLLILVTFGQFPLTAALLRASQFHEGIDALSRWSPDGKWIAFSSLRNGNYDVFIIPAQGGPARQVTLSSSNDWISDWSPDGQKLLFYSARGHQIVRTVHYRSENQSRQARHRRYRSPAFCGMVS